MQTMIQLVFKCQHYFKMSLKGISKYYRHRSLHYSSYLTDILAADTQNVKKNPTGSHLKGVWQRN